MSEDLGAVFMETLRAAGQAAALSLWCPNDGVAPRYSFSRSQRFGFGFCPKFS
jgi:hypothetical protein